MLPSFIIDQIRKREEDERHQRERKAPVRELPMPKPIPREQKPDEPERGVVIIDLGAGD